LAVSFADRQQYSVSEASVYRLLKAHDLITSPAFILMKAADTFVHPTTALNQLWQTEFTYLRVIGWGWFYLSTVLGPRRGFFVSVGAGAGAMTNASQSSTTSVRARQMRRVLVVMPPRPAA
jgi:hypothetical protein